MQLKIYKGDDPVAVGTALDLSKAVLPPSVTSKNRTESVNYTLGGSAIIDRIADIQKVRMELTFPLITKELWERLKSEFFTEMSFKVLWDGHTYEMRVDGEIPTPVLFVKGQDYTAADIKITLEEL